MKKWVCVIIMAVLCMMLFTACGNSGQQSNRVTTQSPTTMNNSTTRSTEPEKQSDTTAATEVQTEKETETSAEVSPETAAAVNAVPEQEETGKVLVVYYSASGNTKAVGDTIAQHTGGDTFELIPVEAYSDEDLNWTNANSRVCREHNDESLQDIALVSTSVESFDSYDTIFIGYPIWWHEAAWVVNNFVKENDFTGKTVIPFCTSSSSGLGESGVHLAEMAGTGDWQEGQRFRGSAGAGEVTEWLESIGF